jgi:TP901 family phage tail tape measure protein
VIVSLLANVDSFKASMAEAQGSMDETAASSEASAGGLSSFAKVGLLAVGAAVVGVAAGAVDMGLKFQDSTHALAASADISVAAANRIGAAFTGQAFSTTFSAETTIKAYTGVAAQMDLVAGHVLSAAQSLAFMKTAQDLAEGSGNALGSTTSDLAKVMQAYQIPLKGASDASNILFNVSRGTGVGLDTVSQSLARAKAAMGAAAPPLSTMGGLMLDLTQHGETGRQAISALTSAFTGVISPTAAVTAAQQAMGLSFINAKTGGLDPMSQILTELAPVLKGHSAAEDAATLKTLGFGAASTKLAETFAAGPAVLDKYTASVTAAGSAHDAAAKQAATLKGQVDILKSGFGDLATNLGSVLVPILTKVISAVTSVAEYFEKNRTAALALGIGVGLLAAGLTAMVTILLATKVATMAQAAATSVVAIAQGVWNGITTVATGLQWLFNAALLANPIALVILAIVAIIAIGVLLITHWTQVVAIAQTVWKDVSGFFTSMWHDVSSAVGNLVGDVVGFFAGLYTKIQNALSGAVTWLVTTGGNIVTGLLNGVKNIWTTVNNWFNGLALTVQGWLGGAGTWLFNIGKSIITGLLNGIKSAINDVKNFVSGIAGSIMSWKGPLDYDATILIPHGNAIMAGLVAGIQQGLNGPVKAALGQVTSTIAGTSLSPMSLGAGNLAVAGGGGGGIGGAASGRQINITYNIPVTGDMSPQTALYVRQQFDQHDQQLITTLNAL